MLPTLSQILVLVVLALGFGCTRPSRKATAGVQQQQKQEQQQVSEAALIHAASVPVAPKVFWLPAGTRFSVRLNEGLSADKNPAGSEVRGELAAPISAFAETIAPRGSKVFAVVGAPGPEGLTLRATKIQLKNGKSYEIASDEPHVRPEGIPAESLVGFRLRNPVQVTVE